MTKYYHRKSILHFWIGKWEFQVQLVLLFFLGNFIIIIYNSFYIINIKNRLDFVTREGATNPKDLYKGGAPTASLHDFPNGTLDWFEQRLNNLPSDTV